MKLRLPKWLRGKYSRNSKMDRKLLNAVKRDDVADVMYCLLNGASLKTARAKYDDTALHLAARHNSLKVADVLMGDQDAIVNAVHLCERRYGKLNTNKENDDEKRQPTENTVPDPV